VPHGFLTPASQKRCLLGTPFAKTSFAGVPSNGRFCCCCGGLAEQTMGSFECETMAHSFSLTGPAIPSG
jgi:hypothetical protein